MMEVEPPKPPSRESQVAYHLSKIEWLLSPGGDFGESILFGDFYVRRMCVLHNLFREFETLSNLARDLDSLEEDFLVNIEINDFRRARCDKT